jgi:hypothetical protein
MDQCPLTEAAALEVEAAAEMEAATEVEVATEAEGQIHRWQLVKYTGNPWVFLAIPIPILTKTHTRGTGTGFFMGQFFRTLTQPIPIPVAGNPQVCREIVMPF